MNFTCCVYDDFMNSQNQTIRLNTSIDDDHDESKDDSHEKEDDKNCSVPLSRAFCLLVARKQKTQPVVVITFPENLKFVRLKIFFVTLQPDFETVER